MNILLNRDLAAEKRKSFGQIADRTIFEGNRNYTLAIPDTRKPCTDEAKREIVVDISSCSVLPPRSCQVITHGESDEKQGLSARRWHTQTKFRMPTF